MTEEEREKLIELRKKKQDEKEMEYSLHKDLDLEEREQKKETIRSRLETPYIERTMIFVVTLFVLYTFFFLAGYIFLAIAGVLLRQMNINLAWVIPVIHLFIWSITIWSVIRKKSVLEDVVDFFS